MRWALDCAPSHSLSPGCQVVKWLSSCQVTVRLSSVKCCQVLSGWDDVYTPGRLSGAVKVVRLSGCQVVRCYQVLSSCQVVKLSSIVKSSCFSADTSRTASNTQRTQTYISNITSLPAGQCAESVVKGVFTRRADAPQAKLAAHGWLHR